MQCSKTYLGEERIYDLAREGLGELEDEENGELRPRQGGRLSFALLVGQERGLFVSVRDSHEEK